MLIVIAAGFILVGTVSQGGASSFSQLTEDIAGCLCTGSGAPFKYGCKTYLWNSLQRKKTPEESASRATDRCEIMFGPTKPNNNAKCKEGVSFLRNKE